MADNFEGSISSPLTLEEATWERNEWVKSALEFSRKSDYYRGLVLEIGQMLGVDIYVSDDGSVPQEELCAKIPEMVAALIERR